MKPQIVSVVSLLLFAQKSLQDDSPAQKACKALEDKYPKLTAYGLDPTYIKANTGACKQQHDIDPYLTKIDFYTSSAFLGPACVFEPSDSYQMADAVLTFQNFSSPFAVRGGGHMPSADAANINSTGVLLSTAALSQVQVSDDRKTVNVGPGNHWVDVYKSLEPYGLTVVGGRLGIVGVPGLLLGGGVSYFGNEYGWASANIASFTVRAIVERERRRC